MKTCVFDIEANGLQPTKIHCLVAAIYSKGKWIQKTTSDYDQMRGFFEGSDILIGHNISLWDIPVIERLLGIKIKAKIIDTLALSWYLYPEGVYGKKKHGLADWGEYFGVSKPKVTNEEWMGPLEGETQEEFQYKMNHRCQEDVKINCALLDKQLSDLHKIYEDKEGEEKLIDYLMFKMDCARAAEKSRWKLDVDRCKDAFDKLSGEKSLKVIELAEAMPVIINTSVIKKPDNMYLKGRTYNKPKVYEKSNGDLSKAGERFNEVCKAQDLDPKKTYKVYVPSKELTASAIKWLEAAESMGLKEDHDGDVEVEGVSEKGNPNSSAQIKSWLDELGWKPLNFSYSQKKDEDGKEYTDKIPQVRVDGKDGKELCPSVKTLFKFEPKLELLEGLSVLTHRIGILKGYLSNVDEEGYLKARISGFTNTLRFKHSVIVNLPSVDKPYGDIVRGVLIAPEGYELCGSDMSALENRTRDHFIYPYDPEYVETMKDKSYDPHLAIAVQAGFMTEEQSEFYKWYKKNH
jgi:hypothetical protein